ncbi:MAG: hypothetical protein LBI40_03495 [Treponema sp.]|jgi:hypothetical protein|nr:hypothetical protein [Treponema sp.]
MANENTIPRERVAGGIWSCAPLIGEDPNTILFNTYDSGWVGIEEDGSYKSMKDIASRIRNAYKIRLCRVEYDDVDALMPPDMRTEYEAEMARRIAIKEERE